MNTFNQSNQQQYKMSKAKEHAKKQQQVVPYLQDDQKAQSDEQIPKGKRLQRRLYYEPKIYKESHNREKADKKNMNQGRRLIPNIISAHRTKKGWEIVTEEESSKKRITTKISKRCSCNCSTFLSKKQTCKHIYSLICNINGDNSELLDYYDNTKNKMEAFIYDLVDGNFLKAFKTQKENLEIKKKLKQEKQSCIICTSDLRQTDESELIHCKVCRSIFHIDCLNNWRKQKKNCPTCRSYSFSPDESEKLGKININEVVMEDLVQKWLFEGPMQYYYEGDQDFNVPSLQNK